MTNKTEKQFFDTFGIEPKLTFYDLVRLREATNQEIGGRCVANWQGETKEETIRRFSPRGWKVLECKDVYIYPQITDSILLELICIAHISPVITFVSRDIKSLKEEVLMVLCNRVNNRSIKHQVRTLFKEDINDR